MRPPHRNPKCSPRETTGLVLSEVHVRALGLVRRLHVERNLATNPVLDDVMSHGTRDAGDLLRVDVARSFPLTV